MEVENATAERHYQGILKKNREWQGRGKKGESQARAKITPTAIKDVRAVNLVKNRFLKRHR
jgi:hypothetical protein